MRWFRERRQPEEEPWGSREERQAARIAELTASRRAIADAYEVERQRIERDLHDGAQQYLVAASIKLGEAALDAEGMVLDLVRAAKGDLDAGLDSLRTIVRGVHPQVLSDHGLEAAVRDAAAGYGPHVRVRAPHPLPRLSPSVVAAGYFFAAEALTNAAKHAPGAAVSVLLSSDESLRIVVVDEGGGGATLRPGHGLWGMRERLAAFGGELTVVSPPGGPTRVACCIPLLLERGHSALGGEGR
ncbi:sensor histidine kinase [Corynebacterium mastitidis]|uniref:sensor histidine kinase n=1 Tax=Corynebacterium mastitidis TaxID=161890 RepID=UPI00254D263F|nr:histidine kinase [Corynebacterium mastitidis]MDK8449482.1 histidine kinase [Corynebacterium mastitidis]